MSFTFKIEGEVALKKAFDEKRKEMEEVFIKDLDEGADAIVASAKGNINTISGDLAGLINKNEIWNKGGIISISVGVEVSEIFPAAGFYDRIVEKGTSRVKAHPYLRPALNENKAKIQNKIKTDLKEVIGNEGNL